MIIDGKDSILGRVGTYVAKQALLGNKVDVINCEECIVGGKKDAIIGDYLRRLHRKAPTKGPYFYRRPDMFVKRTIRGMLPHKRTRGREAFKRIRCHIGVPDNFKNEKALLIENAGLGEKHSKGYLKVKDICKAVGGKI